MIGLLLVDAPMVLLFPPNQKVIDHLLHMNGRVQHLHGQMTYFLKVINDEMKQRELLMADEEEDFLDECIVNPSGKGCPTVLLLCAATLLSEITAYMRETYKSVPKQVPFQN